MSSRKNERAEYKAIRGWDKEWWKPLARLPDRVRREGRRIGRLIRKLGTTDDS
jgi:hypothetical protein